MHNNLIRTSATVAVFFAFFVVMLGAYTRLTDAGLGCPDWPGCYGQLVLPQEQQALQQVQHYYPQLPIETRKAWTEMIHRYAAGTLAILIFFISFSLLKKRLQEGRGVWHLPLALLLLVLFQAMLGMWTVTLKLLPLVVMGHLLGGVLIVGCLTRLRFQLSSCSGSNLPAWRWLLRVAVVLIFLQIALGGWVSSNYAGIACIGFPTCNGSWWPNLHFAQGFNLFTPVGANYQGGLLPHEARVSIQFIHRLGAVIVALYCFTLALAMRWCSQSPILHKASLLLILVVALQFILGILNVLYLLPIQIAVAHNGVAALLLATVFSLLHFTRQGEARCKVN